MFFIKEDINEYLEKIKENFEMKDKILDRLREENKRLKDEAYKDSELKRMKEELNIAREDLWRGFPISKEEKNAINDWCKKHDSEVHGLKSLQEKLEAGGSIGGRYSYHFVPTSIGVSGVIRCDSCGEMFEFQEIG